MIAVKNMSEESNTLMLNLMVLAGAFMLTGVVSAAGAAWIQPLIAFKTQIIVAIATIGGILFVGALLAQYQQGGVAWGGMFGLLMILILILAILSNIDAFLAGIGITGAGGAAIAY